MIRSISFQITPARKTIMAKALIKCMILRFVFSGLFGSFFLKKYIKQMYKINQISHKGHLVK
jgi:hypothetical protein